MDIWTVMGLRRNGKQHTRLLCALWMVWCGVLPLNAERPEASVSVADGLAGGSVAEALLRLPDFDLRSRPDLMEKLDRYLRTNQGTTRYFQLVRQFELTTRSNELLALAISRPDTTAGTWAAETLVHFGKRDMLEQAVQRVEIDQAIAAVRVIANIGDADTYAFFSSKIANDETPFEIRHVIATALADQPKGEQFLADWVAAENYPPQLAFTIGNILHSSQNEGHRKIAARYLPRPETSGGKPLPPLRELVKRRGDRERGRDLFFSKAQCVSCHQVARQGKPIGPDLTEIGSKLSRVILYTSILDPSAAISHNYENHELVTVDGKIETGILLSRDATGTTLKNAEGIVRSFANAEIESFRTLPISLMPSGIEKKLTEEELVDLVQFLASLKNSR